MPTFTTSIQLVLLPHLALIYIIPNIRSVLTYSCFAFTLPCLLLALYTNLKKIQDDDHAKRQSATNPRSTVKRRLRKARRKTKGADKRCRMFQLPSNTMTPASIMRQTHTNTRLLSVLRIRRQQRWPPRLPRASLLFARIRLRAAQSRNIPLPGALWHPADRLGSETGVHTRLARIHTAYLAGDRRYAHV